MIEEWLFLEGRSTGLENHPNKDEDHPEETQVGLSAIKFNLAQPKAMYDAHDWWLSALKVRSENAVKK